MQDPINLVQHSRQTCGYPFTNDLLGQVRYVATQTYHTPYNHGPNYASLVLVRSTDTAQHIQDMYQTRVAVNSEDSQSGYHALRSLIAPIAQGLATQDAAFFQRWFLRLLIETVSL